jgi:hypothetical protein
MRSSHRTHDHELAKRLPAKRVLTTHAPPATKTKVKHVAKTAFRVMLCIAIVHLGILVLDHFGIFSHFGHTGEFVTGSIVDYLLVGSWEGEVPI